LPKKLRLGWTWLNCKVGLQKKYLAVKRGGRLLLKSAQPFLKGRYWLIYLIFFSAGVYLFGPTHGLQKLGQLKFKNPPEKELTSISALQKELNQLKMDLRKVKDNSDIIREEFNPNTFGRPALGKVIKGFTWIYSNNSWRLHTGVDIAVEPGSSVMAAAEGKVLAIGKMPDGSFAVTLDHGGGWESVYSNLAMIKVYQGQTVIKGVIVGESGNWGCATGDASFHFAVLHKKEPVDPQKVVAGLSE